MWLIPATASADQCQANFTLDALKTLKKNQFAVSDSKLRNHIALKLLACLGHSDPKVRDGIVYEASSHWLRNELLTPTTIKSMFDSLIVILKQPNQDPLNFTQPFAALVLSEVIRVDRITPYLTDVERQKSVNVTSAYMGNINDYRGFDDAQGWRHSVAHTADIFLQLALNKKLTKQQLSQLLTAIKSQVIPKEPHFYIYGEPKRLALPLVYIVLRGLHTEAELVSLLESIVDPTPYGNWQSVYTSNQGLAKLHNTRSFINSVLALAMQSDNEMLKTLKPKLIEFLQTIG